VERQTRARAGVLALLFLALHLPSLPRSLEDLDSINFALGIRDFDVARHQPHPPGYPIFMVLAKAAHWWVPSEAHALAVVSAVAGALAVFALAALFTRLDGAASGTSRPPVLMATALAALSPLFWVTAARPLSDMAGLAAALGAQALIVGASGARGLAVAAFCAALAVGVRSQSVWLTAPLLVLVTIRHMRRERLTVNAGVALPLVAFGAGLLVWAVPLVLLSGGASAYWRALSSQGAEDFSGVVMLWTTPTPRQAALALYSATLAPWGPWPLGLAVAVGAAAGCARLARENRAGAVLAAAAFGPYLLFDLLFQEAATVRYALPLVVPAAYAASWGAFWLPRTIAGAAGGVLVAASLAVGALTAFEYSREEAPAFRLLADMKSLERPPGAPMPVLATHRREDLDMRRPFLWTADEGPAFAVRLPAPPKHEWLELVKYWNSGGRGPVWLIADPLRSDLALVSHAPPRAYRWSMRFPVLIGGSRPSEMDWHSLEAPDWYLGEGWAVTPETAGTAREDRRGPRWGAIRGWIRRWPVPSTIMIGGRHLAGGSDARVRLALDGRELADFAVVPGFFLKMVDVPPSVEDLDRYSMLSVSVAPPEPGSISRDGTAPADVSIEQFDAGAVGDVLFGYSDGWHEREYNPSTGQSWRWTSGRSSLRVRSRRQPLVLRLDGETETFDRPSRVVVRAGDRVIDDREVGRRFSVEVKLPPDLFEEGERIITIETDQTYVPAERRFKLRPVNDRRRLGLKVYRCSIDPAS
jgi:hypothetical protein